MPAPVEPPNAVDSAIDNTGKTFELELADSAIGIPLGRAIYEDSFVISASRPPTEVNETLRRERLRAAAGFFLVIFFAALIGRSFTTEGLPWIVHAVVLGGVGGAFLLLTRPVELSPFGVKTVECVTFGLAAAFLAFRQYQTMNHWAVLGDESEMISTAKTTLIGTMLLVFAYCMLIPNTWRYAALMVLAFVSVPVLTEVVVYTSRDAAFKSFVQFAYAKPGRLWSDAGLMVIGAGLSVYGTYVINALRAEAHEARQLNQYKLSRKLGRGGMGEVYLAEHQLLKRPCALKLLRADSASDPVSLSRFEREVRATAMLSHPNTVEIYDYGRTEAGEFFYVMEFLRGKSLDDIIKKHGPMPPGRVVFLLRQVCGALSEAHAAGLIHRDVKPANIFACYRGGRHDVAKLLDFGLVKEDHSAPPLIGDNSAAVSRVGMVHGTPLYMAPEQVVADADLDQRCDLYAMGAVAYMLLTGRPPFVGTDRTTVMTAQVRDPVVPPHERRAEIPEDLEAIVMRCLSKSREDRYPDATALSEALSACASAVEWNHEAAATWWDEVDRRGATPHNDGL